MTYRDKLTALSGATETAAVALHTAWEADEITDAEFEAALAAIVAQANSRATALADLSLAAAIALVLRRPVAPLGLVPPASDSARLLVAASTLRAALAGTADAGARVGRLGRAEPLTAAAAAYSNGMAASPHVTGWVRRTSANACQLCTWWARDGRIWPDDHPMPTHKGCTCTPVPTVR